MSTCLILPICLPIVRIFWTWQVSFGSKSSGLEISQSSDCTSSLSGFECPHVRKNWPTFFPIPIAQVCWSSCPALSSRQSGPNLRLSYWPVLLSDLLVPALRPVVRLSIVRFLNSSKGSSCPNSWALAGAKRPPTQRSSARLVRDRCSAWLLKTLA